MNPIYIGQTAAKAQQSHGACCDGTMSSRGGPHHPQAGCFEEPRDGSPQKRLRGVQDLAKRYVDPDMDMDSLTGDIDQDNA